MTIFEKIKNRILKMIGATHLDDNPNSERYTFINDENTVKRQKLEEARVWYIGDDDELQNYYTTRNISGNAREPIYNRNKPYYFWGLSVKENPVKKVHSGIPNAIITTLSNVIGMPQIDSELYHDKIKNILDKNNFVHKLTQEARPLTCVEGYGAWKIIFNKEICDYPILQFYEGKDVDFISKCGIIIGIIYRDYYKYQNKDYVLMETRRIENGNSLIEFELFRLDKGNEVTQVPLKTIPELDYLPEQGYCIEGLKKILGVPSRYFYDLNNKEYGRSLFTGKISLFDDLDQSLSQRSQTCRVSTPVEYYPIDLLERNANGETIMPSVYNRQFIKSGGFPNGDGKTNDAIITTQPELHFDQYNQEQMALLDMILTGILSPATLGIDMARKDNADAQREKEKVTIMTRDNIIDSETKELKELITLALIIQEYMDTDAISLMEYDISVKYCEFANPSFENLVNVLSPVYASGGISTEIYVDKLYGDSLSEQEKQKEIEKLSEYREKDNLQLGGFELNENSITGDSNSEAKPKEEPNEL